MNERGGGGGGGGYVGGRNLGRSRAGLAALSGYRGDGRGETTSIKVHCHALRHRGGGRGGESSRACPPPPLASTSLLTILAAGPDPQTPQLKLLLVQLGFLRPPSDFRYTPLDRLPRQC